MLPLVAVSAERQAVASARAPARARGVVAVSYFHNDVEAGTQQLGGDQSPGGTCGASESGFKINGAFTAPTANAGAGVVVDETGL